MPTATMQEALRAAAIARALRQAEMGDARLWRDSMREAGTDHARAMAAGHVVQHVARARKWNRQLVIATRAIRVGLFARRRPGRPRFSGNRLAVRP